MIGANSIWNYGCSVANIFPGGEKRVRLIKGKIKCPNTT